MYEVGQNKEKTSHTFPSKVTGKVRQCINDNRKKTVPQKYMQHKRSYIFQFIKKCELKNDMGDEFKAKHIADSCSLPSMGTREEQENILESIYYHRDKNDRKAKHTMLFCKSTVLCNNLLNNINDTDEIFYSKKYVSSNTYPVITILRSYNEQDNRYSKAEFEYGDAQIEVMIKQEKGTPCFDHLVGTKSSSLNKSNLIG